MVEEVAPADSVGLIGGWETELGRHLGHVTERHCQGRRGKGVQQSREVGNFVGVSSEGGKSERSWLGRGTSGLP